MKRVTRFMMFFSDLFSSASIIDSRLQIFCRYAIATITVANIEGIFDDVLLKLNTAYLAYFGELKEQTINKAIKKGKTKSLNLLVRQFADAVRLKYNLIASVYPIDTEAHTEFFPDGLTAFSKLNRGNILEITNQFAVTAEKYKAQLGGAAFVAIYTGFNTDIIAALGSQTIKKGAAKTISHDIIIMRAPLEDALMKLMFKVGLEFCPDWVKCSSFFDFSLLDADHHDTSKVYSGKLTGLQVSNCLSIIVTDTSIYKMDNPNKVPLNYFLSEKMNGIAVGLTISVDINSSKTVVFTDFGAPSGLYLNVANISDYDAKWKVTIKA